MRRSLGTVALLVAVVTPAGCGSGGGDADDVPTITTRPSVTPTVTVPTVEVSTAAPVETTPAAPSTSSDPTDDAPTSAPPPDRAAGPTSFDDAEARITALLSDGSGEVVDPPRFVTAADVYCLMDDPVISPSCELGNGFITDPAVCGADSTDRVGRIETFEGEPRPVCNADTIREPGATLVPVGDVVVAGNVACGVEDIGVTCIDGGKEIGFFLTSGEYHVFTD